MRDELNSAIEERDGKIRELEEKIETLENAE